MADHNSSLSSSISSFLGSPRIFNDFIGYDHQKVPNKTSHSHFSSQGIGLAILDDSIKDDENLESNDFSKPTSKMVLFGSKLKVHTPPFHYVTDATDELPKSPADFGIKTRDSHISVQFGSDIASNHVNGKLSLSEMELSEDYTCVVAHHGPNPKTIHIFDNCIVDNCCGVVDLSELKTEHELLSETHTSHNQCVNFLRFCHTCKDKLQDGKDIYMYRDEKAFCSHECRCQEMLCEGENDSGLDY